jgi:hypothetical protein|tara:strand:- start:71 stop:511 length:441 start_codon:yes stop_codon:yes gene_type:complete
MEILLKRYKNSDDTTLGLIFIDGVFYGHTLEDAVRANKIKGVTAIPKGRYQIKYRKVMSPKTEQYRNKFKFFTYHLELQDVPNYKYVYLHIGNKHQDTEGCILLGSGVSSNSLINSTDAFTTFYKHVSADLNQDCEVHITIENINF